MSDLPNPTGYCMCGCGEEAPIARYHRTRDGIKKGQHVRYIKGHWARTQQRNIPAVNTSGLCECGCGEQTPIATRNRPDRGLVKGQPVRFCPGHHRRGQNVPVSDDPGPNPTGLCMCGCGRPTAIAKSTHLPHGKVRGKPMRYLKGHDKRGKPNPPRGRLLARIEAARKRHAVVIDEYRQGTPLHVIAQRHGFAEESSVGWVIARARMRGEIIERRHAPPRPLDPLDARRLARMWRRGATASEMRAAFRWTKDQLGSAVAAARLAENLPTRSVAPTALSIEEQRALKRASTKIKVAGGVSDRQRTLLRLIQASDQPMSSGTLAEVLCLLGHNYAPSAVLSVLGQMLRKGLVARAPAEVSYRHAPRWVWFVPSDKEQPASALTLDDAKREAELAALIREQATDEARGQWAEVDYKTVSLDAQFSEDGGTFHDILVAGDEPFKAGVIDR